MIYLILVAASAAIFLVDMMQWHKIVYKKTFVEATDETFSHYELHFPFDFKPLNCVVCMAGWFGLALGLINGYEWHSISMLFFSSISAFVINKILYKL
jgi:hypothetical protein